MTAGSITAAAEVLCVSQPAVSRILADLETSISFKLFARINRMMVPTDEGRALFEEVERAFFGLGELDNAAKAIRLCHGGQLRLISAPGIGSKVIAGMTDYFSRSYPDVSISVEVQSSGRLFEWVVSQKCDVGMCALPMNNPAIKVRRFAKGKMYCIMPKGHQLSSMKTIKANDLEGEKFISFQADSTARSSIDAVFTKAGVKRDLQTEARTINVVSAMVEAGLGVSIIGPILDISQIRQNVIVKPFVPAIYTDLAFVFPASKPISLIANRFVESADEYLKIYIKDANKPIDTIQ